MSYIEFKNVVKRFGDNTVLDHIDFGIEQGDLVTLLDDLGERFGHHLTRQVAVRVERAAGEKVVREIGPDRVIVRPSGTEPKIKYYYEAVAPTRAEAQARLDRLVADRHP